MLSPEGYQSGRHPYRGFDTDKREMSSNEARLSLITLMQRLRENKDAVDRFILGFLPDRGEVEEVQMLYAMMKDYPSRLGKGLRSSLCILTCEAFGGDGEKALRTAAALEVFQNWILIHDDIEDSSEMRRGEPVLHRKYGIPLAINAGDALHGRMWEILMDNQNILSESKTIAVVNEFFKMINETTEGQHIELSWVANNRWDLRKEDYYLMCNKKTSWYTCISPCRLGGVIADAGNSKLEACIPFGSKLGIAFQIQDDILNLKGDEKKYGKESGGDIMEGKRTLMLIHLLNRSTQTDRIKILEIMSKNRSDRTQEDVDEILSLMEKYGSIGYARSKAEEYAEDAKKHFRAIFQDTAKTESRKLLEELIDFMIRREW
jgi:geranylgeranyl diphosphate synthase type II